MDLSVVIVNFQTRDKLHECLRSVFASETKYSSEVFAVDNASTDGSAEMVRKEFPEVKLIVNTENAGFAKANNQVIRQITPHLTSPTGGEERETGGDSKYILLLNPDVEVMTDTFEKMIAYMEQHSDVGIAGPRVVRPDGTLDLACRRSFPSPARAFFRLSGLSLLFPRSPLASYNLTYFPEDQTVEVDSVMGAFLLIRRSVVSEIGLLDEDYFMYGEDLDWCFRAKAAGHKVMYVPVTRVVHHKGSSSRKAPRLALREFHRAMEIFYDKHYRARHNFLVNFLVKAGIRVLYLVKLINNEFRREKYVSR